MSYIKKELFAYYGDSDPSTTNAGKMFVKLIYSQLIREDPLGRIRLQTDSNDEKFLLINNILQIKGVSTTSGASIYIQFFYKFVPNDNEDEIDYKACTPKIRVCNVNTDGTGLYPQKMSIHMAINNKIIDCKIKNHMTSFNSQNFSAEFLFIRLDNSNWLLSTNSSNGVTFSGRVPPSLESASTSQPFSTQASFTLLSNPNQNEYSLINRLPYSYIDSNAVDALPGKILTEYDSSTQVSTISSLIDCTNVEPDKIWIIRGKKYYAIDKNTLMQV